MLWILGAACERLGAKDFLRFGVGISGYVFVNAQCFKE